MVVTREAQERGWDKLLLEYEIKSKGLNIHEFCDAVGIARSTYQFWASGKGDWTLSRIVKAAEVLELSGEQILKIFLSQSLTNSDDRQREETGWITS